MVKKVLAAAVFIAALFGQRTLDSTTANKLSRDGCVWRSLCQNHGLPETLRSLLHC